jgi:putative Holliday junction resolvase
MTGTDRESGRILALDVGDARIGIALSDETRLLASPAAIVERSAGDPARRVAELIGRHSASLLLVGLPRNMDGTSGFQARKAEKFAREVAALAGGIEVVFWDERLSTVEAHAIRQRGGASRKARRKPVDALSAAVILQSYLEFLGVRGPDAPRPPRQ